MKKTVFILFVSIVAAAANAQTGGQVALNNGNANNRVSNALTGMLVKTNDFIQVLLYVAPDGVTSEGAFVPIPPNTLVGSTSPGSYNGGTRTIQWAPPGTPVMVQVRAFEIAYGSNYEQAVTAPPINGRPALVGKSAIGRVILGGTPPGGGPPIAPPLVGNAVGPITVGVANGAYLSVNDLVVAEGSNGVVQANFKVSLSSIQSESISVDFATQDGSALAGQDYVSTNGTVTFAPGETVKVIPVLITADEAPEPDEAFFFNLSNPVNGLIARATGSCLITEVRITGISLDTSVSFNTVSNKRYAVEKTTDNVTWDLVPGATNVLGNGSIVSIVDRGTSCQGMAIYRARLLEQ